MVPPKGRERPPVEGIPVQEKKASVSQFFRGVNVTIQGADLFSSYDQHTHLEVT